MKTDYSHLTKRSQSLIEEAKFLKKDQAEDFNVVFDSHDKILTVHYCPQENIIRLLFCEILARFTAKKPLEYIISLSFREIESFLRDENHLPSFLSLKEDELSGSKEGYEAPERVLEDLKISLLAHALKAKNASFLSFSALLLKEWHQHSLVLKNQWAQDLLKEIGKELKGWGSWELVLCEDSALTLTGAPVFLQGASLDLFFRKLLASKKVLPMKVVAV